MTNRIAAVLATAGGFAVGMLTTLAAVFETAIFLLLAFVGGIVVAIMVCAVRNDSQ